MTQADKRIQPLKLFYCYAHEDKSLRDTLKMHLSGLEQQGFISSWDHHVTDAGTDQEQEIKESLNTARIILLLISPDFMTSEWCQSVEIEKALKRHETGEIRIVPVLLRQVEWQHAPFGHLQGLPSEGPPITSRTDIDEAFYNVAKDFRNLFKERLLYKKQQEGDALAMQKQYNKALTAYEQALRLDPGNISLYIFKGEVLHWLKLFDEELATYNEAIRLAHEKSVVPYLCKGELLCDLQQYDEALKVFSQATHLKTTRIVHDKTQTTPSLELYQKFLEAQTHSLAKHMSLAEKEFWEKEYQGIPSNPLLYEALLNCYDTLQKYPNDPINHKRRGDLLLALHRYPVAIQCYEEALHLKPDSKSAHIGLAFSLELLGRRISQKLKWIARQPYQPNKQHHNSRKPNENKETK